MRPILQDLPPKEARLCLRVEAQCKKLLPFSKNLNLLLGVSGGSDSVALTLIFSLLADRNGFRISVLHIDHQLRQTSGQDALFVANLCEKLKIPCIIAKCNVQSRAHTDNCGLEEAGRKVRYELYREYSEKLAADFIITGHHAEDLAEDICLRFLRGAGWPALGGMTILRDNIFRPLLREDPKDLAEFVKVCGFGWREDESNHNLAFKRNRIRHLLMPMLRCENPSINSGCAKINKLAILDADYWQKTLDSLLAATPWEWVETENFISIYLPPRLLDPLHPAARLRLYNHALAYLREQVKATGQHRQEALQGIERIFTSRHGGKIIQCGGGLTAAYLKGGLLFRGEHNFTAEPLNKEPDF